MRDALTDALNGPSYETLCDVNAKFDRMHQWKAANRAAVDERDTLLDRSMTVANDLTRNILDMGTHEDMPDEEILRMRAEYRSIHERLRELSAVLDPSFRQWMAETEV